MFTHHLHFLLILLLLTTPPVLPQFGGPQFGGPPLNAPPNNAFPPIGNNLGGGGFQSDPCAAMCGGPNMGNSVQHKQPLQQFALMPPNGQQMQQRDERCSLINN